MIAKKAGTEIPPTHTLKWHVGALGTLAAISWKSYPVQLTRSPRRKMGQYTSSWLS